MGNLDVRIRHGGGRRGSTALLVLCALAVMAVFGGSLASVGAAVGSLVTTLIITTAIVVGTVLVAAVVLGIVFRRRIAARFRPSPVVWQTVGPERPALTPAPRQEVHLHFHGDSPEAIRRAVRAAAEVGGGTIVIPAGEFDMREVR
jgi:hypothetical protein